MLLRKWGKKSFPKIYNNSLKIFKKTSYVSSMEFIIFFPDKLFPKSDSNMR